MRVFSSVPGSMNENVINRAATMRIRLKNLKVRSFVTQHLVLLLEYNSIQGVEDQEVNVTIGEQCNTEIWKYVTTERKNLFIHLLIYCLPEIINVAITVIVSKQTEAVNSIFNWTYSHQSYLWYS